jgi:hypothetical protein
MFKDTFYFCIQNNKLSPVISKESVIVNSILNIHKKLLSYCHDQEHPNALIFENQLSLSKIASTIDFDEAQRFMDNNKDWDILILGECSLIKDVVPGYQNIYHSSSRTKFLSNSPYIVSKRFMAKTKHNNRSSINTYIYKPYMFNTFMEIDDQKTITGYTVGKIEDMRIENNVINYSWTPMHLD